MILVPYTWLRGKVDPKKVTHVKVRRRWIDTYTIVSAISLEKRKDIFCEDEVLLVFFVTYMIAFCK